MTGLLPSLATALLAGAAAAVAAAPPDGATRLAAVLPRPARPVPSRSPTSSPVGASGSPRVPPALGAGLLAAAAVALLVGGAVGLLLGVVVAVGAPRALATLEPAAVRREREQLEADLPLALELLAACLLGGATLPAAAGAVAAAVPGPCGERLAAVVAALSVGTPPSEAWRELLGRGGVTDRGSGAELAAAVVRALVRAGDGGTPAAGAVVRLAAEAREVARAHGQEAAERAGVLAVGPLGLCFLPAFVLLGIVPVVAGLVGPLLSAT